MVSEWVSNSKYLIDAVVRAVAQMISYEVAIGLIILSVCIPANSFNLSYILRGRRAYGTYVMPLFPMFILFCVFALAEVPFDLLEEESVLVSGYHVEYGGALLLYFFKQNIFIFYLWQ